MHAPFKTCLTLGRPVLVFAAVGGYKLFNYRLRFSYIMVSTRKAQWIMKTVSLLKLHAGNGKTQTTTCLHSNGHIQINHAELLQTDTSELGPNGRV